MSVLGKRQLTTMPKTLVLFDVDGTLTAPREEATKEMKAFLESLKEKVVVGIVGGSDLPKQREQMGENITNEVDYSFSENGLIAYKDGTLVGTEVRSCVKLTNYDCNMTLYLVDFSLINQ